MIAARLGITHAGFLYMLTATTACLCPCNHSNPYVCPHDALPCLQHHMASLVDTGSATGAGTGLHLMHAHM